MPDWLTSSTVVAALLTAFVALQSSERRIKIENVTSERARWREKVRDKALQVHQAAVAIQSERLSELRLEFTVILNPFDEDDLEILSAIDSLRTADSKEELLHAFALQIALLLKHDWERAKEESAPFWRRRSVEPRTSYVDYENKKWPRRN